MAPWPGGRGGRLASISTSGGGAGAGAGGGAGRKPVWDAHLEHSHLKGSRHEARVQATGVGGVVVPASGLGDYGGLVAGHVVALVTRVTEQQLVLGEVGAREVPG